MHFKHGRGDIVIAPFLGEDGAVSWKFTGPTIAHLRPLYMAIEDMPPVSNLRYQPNNLPTYFMFREKIRGYSPFLLKPVGALEIWQWISLIILSIVSLLCAMFLTHIILWALRRNKNWLTSLSTFRARILMLWPMRVTLVGLIWYYYVRVLGLPESFSSPLHNIAGSMAAISSAWLLFRGAGLVSLYSRKSIGTKGHNAVSRP